MSFPKFCWLLRIPNARPSEDILLLHSDSLVVGETSDMSKHLGGQFLPNFLPASASSGPRMKQLVMVKMLPQFWA